MIEKTYSKTASVVKQDLTLAIQADKKTVFHFLATTDGISAWFPQLSIGKEDEEQLVLFDMGDGTFEKMKLLDYQTDNYISYEWATGKVEFQLEENTSGTQLTLREELPLNFAAIPEDFTGWYVQMMNIKNVAETGEAARINRDDIKAVKEEILAQLKI